MRDHRHIVVFPDFRQDQDKLVSPLARHGVAFAHVAGKTGGYLGQQCVAGIVAEAVVDVLEIVQIDEQYRQAAVIAARGDQRLAEAILEQVAVGKPGQRIVIGLALKLALMGLALGDVVLDADKMRDLAAFVSHWRDQQLVPEQAAVLAVIAQQHTPFALLADGLAQFLNPGLVSILVLQEIAVAPQRLLRGIAGNALERRVGVDQRIARHFSVGDEDGVDAGFDGAAPHAQPFLLMFAFGDILLHGDEMGDFPRRVFQRRNDFGFPEQFAALFPVEQLAAPYPA